METFVPDYDMGIDFSKVKTIILARKPADLRKGIDGYVSLVQGCLDLDPVDGSLFLFVNRQKNKMKGILFDGNGFWMVYKRVARSHLSWPISDDDSDFIRITSDQLRSMLMGLSIVPGSEFACKRPKYV